MSNFLRIGSKFFVKGMNRFAVFSVLVLCLVGLVSGQSLDSPAWKDTPSYFQDSTVDVRFSDVIDAVTVEVVSSS